MEFFSSFEESVRDSVAYDDGNANSIGSLFLECNYTHVLLPFIGPRQYTTRLEINRFGRIGSGDSANPLRIVGVDCFEDYCLLVRHHMPRTAKRNWSPAFRGQIRV